MKIEAGKYYKTRGGEKAFVAAVLKNPNGGSVPDQPIVGFIGDNESYSTWSIGGGYYDDDEYEEDEDDLVAEWREPYRFEVAIVNYERGPHAHVGPVGSPWAGDVVARKTFSYADGSISA
jgi:hypothetical protein